MAAVLYSRLTAAKEYKVCKFKTLMLIKDLSFNSRQAFVSVLPQVVQAPGARAV